MSRPVKVPEALYVSLCEDAERNVVTVMAALEAQLQRGAQKLASLTAERERLGNALTVAEANLDHAEASHRACRADAERLQGEVQRLRLALEDREKRIAELRKAVAT
jgi:chromosome segregation ATPase